MLTKKVLNKLSSRKTLKDLELRKVLLAFPEFINLKLDVRMELIKALERDTMFLKSQGIMDYSLLLVIEKLP